ncbi:hypothetical protein [Pseudoalteromonas luteoviolacea]|uniref:DUF1579 domain-containing protein n=1 Tax=Pseudoalteromonas luteoviolacea DSM 6061 TaxID=1365250 RepID=A0A161ZZX5_9GAMM|nr:hypothetical protein [Pseudoalteromonas luteoviolacea]KZN40328.1 hypothetical protein N475_12745 [Pseudoalteromonas luteoviolacea DSM 6061]KZN57292.1 hypothetical protein N474_08815 [Pseudoalteromonas luteoviolacea CPMOR-2]MBE0387892.1 hypothetical protein [Pseudoalteromonas luteoviolacea DSM 6061]TQF72618.1 hypothetical protein FLM44_16885 [Pseudoalteromonas luteoviolacea]
MKYINGLLVGVFLFAQSVWASTIADELKVFEPYLGTWQASFSMGEGQKVTDVSRWERALNGTAIRTLHSINDGAYGGESLLFWDKGQQSIVFYYFTTAGFYTSGKIEVLSKQEFVAYEAVEGNQDGITEVKSTSRFKNGEFTVSTQYLKNGQWTQPELRTYRPSNKSVKFK